MVYPIVAKGAVMLRFELTDHLLIDAQEAYLNQGTAGGARIADQVRMLRRAYRGMAASFNRRQERDPKGALQDGRIVTIRSQILDPYGAHAWPTRSARMLLGISLAAPSHLPDTQCRKGGPTYRALDPESYVAVLADGPPQEREFGEMLMLVAYLDLVRTMQLVWIGREQDAGAALTAFHRQTGDLTDWSAVNADYAELLAEKCRSIGT